MITTWRSLMAHRSSTLRAGIRGRRGARRCRDLLGQERDREPEGRRLARSALGPDPAAVRLDDALRDVEAEAAALDRAGPRVAGAHEPLEQARQLLGRDPVAAV